MPRPHLWFCAAIHLVALGSLTATSDAHAEGQPKTTAQGKAREAGKLADKGQHDKALVLFKEAYDTYQEPGYLYNIGIEYQALGREPEAFDAFERFLKDVEKIPPEFVADANQQKRELQKRLVELEIKATQEGAHIIIDDREVAITPIDRSVRVRAGTHRIVARKDGFEPYQTTITAEGGAKMRIEALMRPVPIGAALSGASTGTSGPSPNVTPPATAGAAAGGSQGGALLNPPEVPNEPAAARRPFHLTVAGGVDIWASGVPRNPQPSGAFSLGLGYQLARLGPGAELRLGAKFGFTTLAEPANTDIFFSAVANAMISFTLIQDRLFGFIEAGAGIQVISGVARDSVLLEKGSGQVTGALSSLQIRPAVGLAYSLTPAVAVYLSPGVAWAPSPSPEFVNSSILQIEFAGGLMLRL